MNQQAPLNYIDGETLAATVLPPIRFVVPGLLPQGLNILAGAPKVGKSWLALWLCLNVAEGNAIWELPAIKEAYDNIEKFLPIIWKYTDVEELDARILNELIEKIVVHEKEVDEDGNKSQHIEIYYKFIVYVNMRKMLKNGVICQENTPDGPRLVRCRPAG